MGTMIPNMPFPEGCGRCWLNYVGEDDDGCPRDICVLTGSYVWSDFFERADNCPLTQPKRRIDSLSTRAILALLQGIESGQFSDFALCRHCPMDNHNPCVSYCHGTAKDCLRVLISYLSEEIKRRTSDDTRTT